jgi:hypothetical protein
VPNKKNYWSITMVNPQHIASKKYRNCATTRSVSNFCNRYRVNRFWWRPPSGGQKILMVDWQNFKDSYKDVYGTFPRASFTKPKTTNWNKKTKWSNRRTRTYSKTRKTSRY